MAAVLSFPGNLDIVADVSQPCAAYLLLRDDLTPGDRVLLNGSNDDDLLSVTAHPADRGL